jgi:hypothetical protein
MPGLVPGIHVFLDSGGMFKSWMPATSAGMTNDTPSRRPQTQNARGFRNHGRILNVSEIGLSVNGRVSGFS